MRVDTGGQAAGWIVPTPELEGSCGEHAGLRRPDARPCEAAGREKHGVQRTSRRVTENSPRSDAVSF